MEAIAAIMTRHSIRKYQDADIPEEHIETILRAARQAPNAGNRQDWYFVVVRSQQLKNRMAEAMARRLEEMASWPEAAPVAERLREISHLPSFLAAAPVVLVFFAQPFESPIYHILDAHLGLSQAESKARHMLVSMQSISAAIQNALLAAHALGYGACWMGAGLAADDVKALLEMEDPWEVAAYVPIGVPDEQPRDQPRKPLEDVCRMV